MQFWTEAVKRKSHELDEEGSLENNDDHAPPSSSSGKIKKTTDARPPKTKIPTMSKMQVLKIQNDHIQDFTKTDVGATDVKKAADFYESRGYVVIRVATDKECTEMVQEQWNNIICKQGFRKPEGMSECGGPKVYRTKNPDDMSDKSIIKKEEEDDHMEKMSILQKPLSGDNLSCFIKHWTIHMSHGASCDPQSMHMPNVWKFRQNRHLYDFAKHVMAEEKLWVHIDRCIQKLPTQGVDDSFHWDFDPCVPTEAVASTIQGKIMWTKSLFTLIPESHTKEFIDNYVRGMTVVSGDNKASGSNVTAAPVVKNTKVAKKHYVDTSPTGPNVCGKKTTLEIPPGCAIFWNENLIRGEFKTNKDHPIEWGMYMGYHRIKNREAYGNMLKSHIEKLSRTRLVLKTKAVQEEGVEVARSLVLPSEADIYGYETQLKNVQACIMEDLSAEQVLKESELLDRLRSFVYQTAPILSPSCVVYEYFPSNHTHNHALFKRIENCCTFPQIETTDLSTPFLAYQKATQKHLTKFTMPVIIPQKGISTKSSMVTSLTDVGLELLGISRESLLKLVEYVETHPLQDALLIIGTEPKKKCTSKNRTSNDKDAQGVENYDVSLASSDDDADGDVPVPSYDEYAATYNIHDTQFVEEEKPEEKPSPYQMEKKTKSSSSANEMEKGFYTTPKVKDNTVNVSFQDYCDAGSSDDDGDASASDGDDDAKSSSSDNEMEKGFDTTPKVIDNTVNVNFEDSCDAGSSDDDGDASASDGDDDASSSDDDGDASSSDDDGDASSASDDSVIVID